MNTYLTIITTVLVLTQIIRLVQNALQLRVYNKNRLTEREIVAAWSRMERAINKLAEGIK